MFMKKYFAILVFANLLVSGCYTSNQMVISGNRSGGGNGVQRTHAIPSSTYVQPKPKVTSVSQKQNNPNNNKANNTNINNQTTTIYLTNNPSANVVTNTTSFSSPTQTKVKEFIVEESIIPGRYYIIQ
jgi:hypothetical protein